MKINNSLKSFASGVKKVGSAVVKAPGKVLDYAIKQNQGVRNFKEDRNTKMIKDNFGTVENYGSTLKKKKSPIGMLKAGMMGAKKY